MEHAVPALCAVLAFSIVPVVASAASAQEGIRWRAMRLDYDRAPAVAGACPGEQTFRQMVGLFTKGEDPFEAAAAESVRVTLDIGLSTYVLMSAFLTADVAPGFGLAVDVGGENFFGRLELRGVLPGRAYAREVIPGATSSFPVKMDISQYTALFMPCGRWKYFVGCGVAQVGMFYMEYSAGHDFSPMYTFGPRIGFEVPFAERFAVFGFGEVLFAPSQAVFSFSKPNPDHPDAPRANTKWVAPVASGFFGAGVSVKFE